MTQVETLNGKDQVSEIKQQYKRLEEVAKLFANRIQKMKVQQDEFDKSMSVKNLFH